MKKLTKVIFIIALLAMVVLPLSARKAMNVSWEWLLSDPEVTAYRYQLNGEADDGWTVVDGNTSVYTATGLDPYSDYTLYLQCSYDGINWSESASSTAYALLQLEVETPVEEEIVETVESTVFYVSGFGIENEWTKSSFKSTTLDKGLLTSDDVLGFIQYEAAKYPEFASGVYYTLIDDGFELTYEEGKLDIASLIPVYRADITEYVDGLLASAVEEVEDVIASAAEAVLEAVVEAAAEEPVFAESFNYRGITSDLTVYGTHATVTLPEGTDVSVIENAASLLLAKYPEASYVTYSLENDTVTLYYPEITGEYASSLYPVIKDEAEWYIDQLLGEVVAAEEAAVEEAVIVEAVEEETAAAEEETVSYVYADTLTYRGVTSTIVVDNTWATATVPEGMSKEDLEAVAHMIVIKYPAESSLVVYSFDGETVTLTYPESSDEFLLAALEVLRKDAIALIDMIEDSKVETVVSSEPVEAAPVAEEKKVETAVVEPAAEEKKEEAAVEPVAEEKKEEKADVPAPVTVDAVAVKEEKKDSPKAVNVKASFNMNLNAGFEWGYGKVVSKGASKTPTIYPFVSMSFEGQNLLHVGIFGFGVRSDISAVFIPESKTLASNPTKIWGFDATVDLKLMAYVNTNICKFYLGAGIGYSAASNKFTSVHSETARILVGVGGGEGFNTAFAITGVAGVQFNIGSMFTLSAEGYSRFFFDMPGKLDTLNIAATVGFGVKF